MPLQAHVAAAKAAVDALSHTVAVEFGPRGVTSNVIAPGPIAGTEGMERLAKSGDVPAAMKRVPLGRYGRVKEIADGTVYLFGDTGNFVSGQVLVGELAFFRRLCASCTFVGEAKVVKPAELRFIWSPDGVVCEGVTASRRAKYQQSIWRLKLL